MRALNPVLIAASVALALAGTAAHAQANMSARPTAPSGTATTTTTTSVPGGSATGTPGTTAGTSISGTSSGDAFTGSSRDATSGQTSGTSISGTSSGDAFTGSSRGNAPAVGPGATTTNPLDRNAGAIFNANGERIGTVMGTGGVINPDTGVIASGTDTGATTSANANNTANLNGATADTRIGVVTSTPELDQATRRELQRQRRTVERKGQMMHSLAPRTNVDRTDQMPDDSTPLLSPSRR
jgi:hypothetical protein